MARKTERSFEEALKRALKFLSYRARSEAEIRIKLIRLGYSQKIVEATLEKLRSLKLLDDELFARSWTLGRVEGRGYGPLRVERELRQKGIANSLINEILGEAFIVPQGRDRARALLEKRFSNKDLADVKIFRRAVAFLQRRGYHDSVIAELLKEPIGDH
jgi:regulatory protein